AAVALAHDGHMGLVGELVRATGHGQGLQHGDLVVVHEVRSGTGHLAQYAHAEAHQLEDDGGGGEVLVDLALHQLLRFTHGESLHLDLSHGGQLHVPVLVHAVVVHIAR